MAYLVACDRCVVPYCGPRCCANDCSPPVFLRITKKSAPTEFIISLLFALILLVLMIGGSLWIMTDLNPRMGM
jgi:hypothetical protein